MDRLAPLSAPICATCLSRLVFSATGGTTADPACRQQRHHSYGASALQVPPIAPDTPAAAPLHDRAFHFHTHGSFSIMSGASSVFDAAGNTGCAAGDAAAAAAAGAAAAQPTCAAIAAAGDAARAAAPAGQPPVVGGAAAAGRQGVHLWNRKEGRQVASAAELFGGKDCLHQLLTQLAGFIRGWRSQPDTTTVADAQHHELTAAVLALRAAVVRRLAQRQQKQHAAGAGHYTCRYTCTATTCQHSAPNPNPCTRTLKAAPHAARADRRSAFTPYVPRQNTQQL